MMLQDSSSFLKRKLFAVLSTFAGMLLPDLPQRSPLRPLQVGKQ